MSIPATASLTQPRDLASMLRAHQWVKNLPVFAALFLSGRDGDFESWVAASVAFVAFCLAASGGYCINDVIDWRHDQENSARRPNLVALGRIGAPLAVAGGGMLIIAALLLALYVDVATAAVIGLYALGSLAYSAWVKRFFLIDCLMLSGLFVLRLIAGTVALAVPVSPWLLGFAFPLFLALALLKRCAQIDKSPSGAKLAGRNYESRDRPFLYGLALVGAGLAVLVLVAYVMMGGYAASFYAASAWLWGFPLAIALFLARIVQVLGIGRLDTDPVAFALRDPAALATGGGLVAAFLLARGL